MKRLPVFLPRLAGRRAAFKIGVVATLAIAVAANVAVLGNLGVMFGRVVPGASHNHLFEAYFKPLGNKALAPSQWGIYRPIYRHLTDSLGGSAASAMYQLRGGTLAASNGENRTRFIYLRVTPSLAQVLGVNTVAGRGFNAADARRGAAPVILITAHVAQARFGGNRAAIGKSLALAGNTYRIVGVLPDRLIFPADYPAAGWVPFPPQKAGKSRNIEFGVHALVYPRPGTSVQAIHNALADAFTHALPDYNGGMRNFIKRAKLVPRVSALAQRAYGPIITQLQLLELAALLLLLLVFANLSGLATSDALSRRHELATRIALGASVLRLFKERAYELGKLGLIAWVIGVALGWLGSRGLALTIGRAGPAVTLSAPVLSITLAAVLIVTTLIATSGMRRLRARESLHADLTSGGHTTGGRGMTRTLRAFIVLQLTVSIVLLVVAGHLRANVFGLTHGDIGFATHDRTFLSVILPNGRSGHQSDAQYKAYAAKASAFDHAFLGRLSGLPGTKSAALLSIMPFSNSTSVTSASTSPSGTGSSGYINLQTVSKKIIAALGMRVLAGEPDAIFSATDNAIFVDKTAVSHFWPGIRPAEAIGRHLYDGDHGKQGLRIAAVVEPLRMKPYDSVGGTLFMPFAPSGDSVPGGMQTFVINSTLAPNFLRKESMHLIRAVNPQAQLIEFHPASTLVAGAYAKRNHLARLFGVLALVAILIAATGLFALLAYRSLVRRPEFAIRGAVGATPTRLLGNVLSEALILWIVGCVVGIPAAYALSLILDSRLPELGLPAAWIALCVSACLGLTAFLAALVPARRAAGIDLAGHLGQ